MIRKIIMIRNWNGYINNSKVNFKVMKIIEDNESYFIMIRVLNNRVLKNINKKQKKEICKFNKI